MFFAVITILPEMFTALTEFGITGRAIANHQADVLLINPRDFTNDNYRRIDERPFGGGAGMVMMAEPLAKAIDYAKSALHVVNRIVLWCTYRPKAKRLLNPWCLICASTMG